MADKTENIIRDPIVIDPPGFDPADGWKECREYVEQCGGLANDGGEPNWSALFGADPGCCSCPNCKVMYWSWGRVVECLDCHFQFPTDWWPIYSWGVQEARRRAMDPPPPAYRDPDFVRRWEKHHAKRMESIYYRYGFEHPCEDPWKEHDKLPWKSIVEGQSND